MASVESINSISDTKDKCTLQTGSWSLWTCLSYVIVMLVFGLPLWWNTTTVERAELPYNEMLTANHFIKDNMKINIDVQIKVFGSDNDLKFNETRHVGGELGKEYYFIRFQSNPLISNELELIQNAENLYEIDRKLCSDSFQIKVYQVEKKVFLDEFGQNHFVVGNCRNIYFISETPLKDSLEFIFTSIEYFYENAVKVDDISLSSGYDILFSLLVPEPEILDVTWNIRDGITSYIQPILDKLESFADFSTRSQILYYTKLDVRPKWNQESESYHVSYDQLALVINNVESRLSSFVSENQLLNFLVYISPCSKNPIQIIHEDGSFINSNGFFVPQWGGIQIYNGPCPSSNNGTVSVSTVPHEVSTRSILNVIIPQFRALIGTPTLPNDVNLFSTLKMKGHSLRLWELDMILRKRLKRLLFTSANTLKSLGSLLDQITNIVVKEKVAEEVEKSCISLKLSIREAEKGNLEDALKYAIQSYKSSEIAFHHPSNLAQLYFPDDQKYAIYIPLFLPVGIPVLLSLRSIINMLRNKFIKNF